LLTEQFEFLRSLPLKHEEETEFFVHAGYEPTTPLAEQRVTRVVLWDMLNPARLGWHISGKIGVVGHTVQRDGQALDLGLVICVDTGCGHGGPLTVLDVRSGETWQVPSVRRD
jgi:hypothetical protein